MDQGLSLGGAAVATLAIWRLTHMLWAEDGPWEVFARLRKLAGPGAIGRILDCFNCLSLWVALPFAILLANGWLSGFILWLALSGGAILLERLTAERTQPPPVALWREDDPTAPS